MPSKSKSQQRLFGLALSVKRGDTPPSDVSQSVRDLANSMSEKELKKYASGSQSGKPEKVTESLESSDIKLIRQLIRKEIADLYFTLYRKRQIWGG